MNDFFTRHKNEKSDIFRGTEWNADTGRNERRTAQRRRGRAETIFTKDFSTHKNNAHVMRASNCGGDGELNGALFSFDALFCVESGHASLRFDRRIAISYLNASLRFDRRIAISYLKRLLFVVVNDLLRAKIGIC